MAEEKKEFQLETAFDEIEKIVERLETEELPLKDSLQLYQKGVELAAKCKDELTGIEKELITVSQDAN